MCFPIKCNNKEVNILITYVFVYVWRVLDPPLGRHSHDCTNTMVTLLPNKTNFWAHSTDTVVYFGDAQQMNSSHLAEELFIVNFLRKYNIFFYLFQVEFLIFILQVTISYKKNKENTLSFIYFSSFIIILFLGLTYSVTSV